MELNIPFPDAPNMPDAFGIPDERLIELEDGLANLWSPQPTLRRWHHVASDIAAICKTKEELFHCAVIWCGMLQRAGRPVVRQMFE